MIVKYTGPRRGGLTQIGTLQVQVSWDTPVELPDDLAERLLDQHPDDWVEVDAPARKKATKRKATTPPPPEADTTADEPEEGEAS